MSDDIKPGDLVIVAKPAPCCGDVSGVGKIFVVDKVETTSRVAECTHCRALFKNITFASCMFGYCQVSRLKKIDPPAEGDSLPTRKDLEVTA